jgi:hypothetical protein
MWAFSGQEKTKNVTCIVSVTAAAAIVLSKILVLEEVVFLGSLMIKKLRG